ncbi:MAG TPA: VOC family protein [Blastocatellia bacterium]|nr:VOC family protein [Blastocatellia bacterium]
MANIERHANGSFCWIELGTTDQAAAKKFYGSLFGWSPNDRPVGPDSYYTIFQLHGRTCAAAYALGADAHAKGIPPHWMIYIAVENADQAASRAAKLGGKAVAPAFDVFDAGRMAEINDPTGTHFNVWQPKNNTGIGVKDEDGALCWADLSTSDPSRAAEFYSGLFGWTITAGEKDPYLHIQNGQDFIGGIPPAEYRPPNAPPHWLIYFKVSNCKVAAEHAERLGGKVLSQPMTMEKVGKWAVVADPQGAVFSIFEPPPHS